MKRLSVFLITAALIAGIAGCVNPPPFPTCDLTIASTAGGSVTTPGEGTFTYPLGETVKLVAMADEGYRFVEWTGNVSTIADVEAATTTINMEYYYSITANFAPEALEIRTWYDLNAVRNNLRGHHILMNDLDSTTAGYEELASPTANGGKGWEPIGSWEYNAFIGSLDGQGYEILNLFINRPDESSVGLFARVEQSGVIEDIGLVNVTVTGGPDSVGGLVGSNWGTVSNSYSSGNVTGDQCVGGLVGYNDHWSTVSNSYSTGSVTGSSHVGGLVGRNYESTVSDSYSTGSVTGNSSVGGLVGKTRGTVSNSYSTGSVTGDNNVGGLVGRNDATVSTSFWNIETSGQPTSAGGTGKTTAEMQDIATFSGAGWNIIAVALDMSDLSYTWNIVDKQTYPFLSWES